ncbi:COPII coat Sec23p-Sfb3p heterodimer component [Savitreella phatthalungensis]
MTTDNRPVRGRRRAQYLIDASVHSVVGQVAALEVDETPADPAEEIGLEAYYRLNPFVSGDSAAIQPPADVDFAAVDGGCANPKLLRSSLNLLLSSNDGLQACGLPFSVELQPFATLRHDDEPIPLVDVTQSSPVRCTRCLGFVSPRTRFIDGGARFVCHLCSFSNVTPPDFFTPTDYAGLRQDLESRPELRYGAVEYLVGPDFWTAKKAPHPLHTLFAIDVSQQAVERGVTRSMVAAIRKLLAENGLAGKIGLLSFDRHCQFYNLSDPNRTTAVMCDVGDLEDMFLPFYDGLFVEPGVHSNVIEATLQCIESAFVSDPVPEPAFHAMMRAGLHCLESTGGKLCIGLSSLATWGPEKLRMRENASLYGTSEEKTMLDSAHVLWKNMAEEYVSKGVGVDIFVMPAAYVDVATISTIPSMTGGDTLYYPNFVADRDTGRLAFDLTRACSREQGNNVLIKLRTSEKVSVQTIYGGCIPRTSSSLEMGVLHADKSILFHLELEGKVAAGSSVDLQAAVLYTTNDGSRRLRVIHKRLPITDNPGEALRAADMGGLVTYLTRVSAADVHRKTLKEIKSAITARCIKILTAFRRHGGTSSDKSLLVMPESLRQLPLYALGLQKQHALRTDVINSDMRVANLRQLQTSPTKELLFLLRPRIYDLTSLKPHMAFPDDAGDQIHVPPALANSFGAIPPGAAVLVVNGQWSVLWLRNDVSPKTIKDLLGDDLSGQLVELEESRVRNLPALDGSSSILSIQLRNMLAWLSSFLPSRALAQPYLARQGLDGTEILFAGALIEDRNADAVELSRFLETLHRGIQQGLRESTLDAGKGWIPGTDGFL